MCRAGGVCWLEYDCGLDDVFTFGGIVLCIEVFFDFVHEYGPCHENDENDAEHKVYPESGGLFVGVQGSLEEEYVEPEEARPKHDEASANDADVLEAEP